MLRPTAVFCLCVVMSSPAICEENLDALPKLQKCAGYHAVNLEPFTDDAWSLATLIVKSMCRQEFNKFIGPISLSDTEKPLAYESRFIAEPVQSSEMRGSIETGVIFTSTETKSSCGGFRPITCAEIVG
jgi:hypothetical protein